MSANYAEGRRVVEMFNSGGFAAGDDRTRVRLGVQVVARRGDRVETGHETRGGHAGFEIVSDRPEAVAESAARKAITALDAVDAPAGRMPVVVGNGFGGVLLHEAIRPRARGGRGQKGDVYAGRGATSWPRIRHRLRRRPAAGEWGRRVDDEGRRRSGRRSSRGQADLVPLRQPARAQGEGAVDGQRSARAVPHLPCAHDEHLLRARGGDFGGPDRGHRARAVCRFVRRRPGRARHGRLRLRCLRGLPDRGRQGHRAGARRDADRERGPEALAAIDGIAADLKIATGFCGKGGQRVPAGVGQPHVRIKALTVGGTG